MTERDWGSPYLNEIRRRLRTGRITHAQAQEKLRKAGYVECSDGSMLAPGTTALKRTADGKIDAEYYTRRRSTTRSNPVCPTTWRWRSASRRGWASCTRT